MSRDMMSAFELYQPDTVEGAVELLGRFGAEGWALAGGNDSFDWFKDRVKRPKYVVDLGGIAALKGIRETPDGGVEIGALTTLTEIERSAVIQGRYKLLADAARRVASPQIRNSGTLGGNVCQDARCWYYRYGVDCYRAGGNTLLCGHAGRPEPRALSLGCRPLRRGEPVGYGAGARRARRDDGRARAQAASARSRPRSSSSARTSTSSA